MKNPFRNTPARSLVLAAMLLGGALTFLPERAPANLSARYGTPQVQVGTYWATLPMSSRRVYIGRQMYYLSENVYYKPVMLQGRVVFLAVDTTRL